MALTSGARLGAYEIRSAIGVGGMGEVYRAHDTKLHRDVALKILPELFASDPDPSAGSGSSRARSRDDRLARFEREAQVPASLNHPNRVHRDGQRFLMDTLKEVALPITVILHWKPKP